MHLLLTPSVNRAVSLIGSSVSSSLPHLCLHGANADLPYGRDTCGANDDQSRPLTLTWNEEMAITQDPEESLRTCRKLKSWIVSVEITAAYQNRIEKER